MAQYESSLARNQYNALGFGCFFLRTRGSQVYYHQKPPKESTETTLPGTSGFIDLVSAGPILTPPGAQVIDCKEKLLMPGTLRLQIYPEIMEI